MVILVLEASTTSAKAMLYKTEQGVIDLITEEYLPEHNDVITQDAEGVFNQLAVLGKRISRNYKIDCIALGGVWHSVMLCDKNMKPQTRVYSWANTMAADLCEKIRENKDEVKYFYYKTGCMVNAIYPKFKLLYLKELGYQLENYYILGQGSYNTYRLTGKRVVTDNMASGSGLLNIHTRKYDQDILAEIDIREEQLCEVVSYKEHFSLSDEGAALLGLQPGIPVMPACSDGGLNQVGAGALEEGVMTFSVGTSAAIRLTTLKPVLAKEPGTWCYLSPIGWLSGAATSGACNCTDWFIKNFYHKSYKEIEIKSNQIDGDTPIFLPFLYGERCPGWDDAQSGAFLGVLPKHSDIDFYIAIQEGILFNIFQSYEMLCKLNGKPERILLSGGILKSKFWTQMCVDIFNTEMEISRLEQASLMGATILAMESMGVINEVKDFTYEKGEIIKPNKDKVENYRKKYKIYEYWYNKLKRN